MGAIQGLIRFFDDDEAAHLIGVDRPILGFRNERVIAWPQAGLVYADGALQHIDEALRGRFAKLSSELEFGGILRESRAEREICVDDGRSALDGRQRRADKRVRSLQEMIGASRASALA